MGQFATTITKLITGTSGPAGQSRRANSPAKRYSARDLIRMESKVGAQLFGPVPKGHRREFFCLDQHAWIWYEEWPDAQGKRQSITTRYEIHQNGILKVQDGQPYQVVEGEELHNLAKATRLYREQVLQHMYHRNPVTGRPL